MKDQPAFPTQITETHNAARQMGREQPETVSFPGMTIRQYYKAAALNGLTPDVNIVHGKMIAEMCARIADAMLAEDAEHEGKE